MRRMHILSAPRQKLGYGSCLGCCARSAGCISGDQHSCFIAPHQRHIDLREIGSPWLIAYTYKVTRGPFYICPVQTGSKMVLTEDRDFARIFITGCPNWDFKNLGCPKSLIEKVRIITLIMFIDK